MKSPTCFSTTLPLSSQTINDCRQKELLGFKRCIRVKYRNFIILHDCPECDTEWARFNISFWFFVVSFFGVFFFIPQQSQFTLSQKHFLAPELPLDAAAASHPPAPHTQQRALLRKEMHLNTHRLRGVCTNSLTHGGEHEVAEQTSLTDTCVSLCGLDRATSCQSSLEYLIKA